MLAATLSAVIGQAQSPAPSAPTTPWQLQTSATKAGLRGIHAVGNGVAWASGTNGTILRTEDGGYMWQPCALPPGAEKLDFRGIWAWDAKTAVAMSSGAGDLSRLYKTTDGCSSWKLLYTNPDKEGFWDAVQFWDKDTGFVLGDPVSGALVLLSTVDGGTTWEREGKEQLAATSSAGIFAASNSALYMDAMDVSYIGIGGKSGAYVLRGMADVKTSADGWMKVKVPLASGAESSGVFSLDFRDQAKYPDDTDDPKKIERRLKQSRMDTRIIQHGTAVGGDYKKPNESNGTAAYTTDGGKTWTAATKPPHGYRSAVAWDAADKAWIAAGPNGSDLSYDDGKTWQPLDNGNWNALSLPWVVGPDGRIAKLVSLKVSGMSQK
jgi:photosystem II stability/assembly factor-like uncharacterized protein